MSEPDRDLTKPEGWRVGDVVRSDDGSRIGTVMLVDTYSSLDASEFFLFVDEVEGMNIWPIDGTVLSNDPASIAEARALGLRNLGE